MRIQCWAHVLLRPTALLLSLFLALPASAGFQIERFGYENFKAAPPGGSFEVTQFLDTFAAPARARLPLPSNATAA